MKSLPFEDADKGVYFDNRNPEDADEEYNSYLEGREILTVAGASVKNVNIKSWRWHVRPTLSYEDQHRSLGAKIPQDKVMAYHLLGMHLSVECYAEGRVAQGQFIDGKFVATPYAEGSDLEVIIVKDARRWAVTFGPAEPEEP